MLRPDRVRCPMGVRPVGMTFCVCVGVWWFGIEKSKWCDLLDVSHWYGWLMAMISDDWFGCREVLTCQWLFAASDCRRMSMTLLILRLDP